MHAGAEGSGAPVTGREELYLDEDRGNPEAFAARVLSSGVIKAP